ncbi:hypothetical protein TB1_037235 [Malus domestica]
MPVSLCSANFLFQDAAQRFVECFCKTVGRSMIHGRLMLLEFVFLTELINESVGELFFIVGDDVARHTISIDDMLFDEMNDSFLSDFLDRSIFMRLS